MLWHREAHINPHGNLSIIVDPAGIYELKNELQDTFTDCLIMKISTHLCVKSGDDTYTFAERVYVLLPV